VDQFQNSKIARVLICQLHCAGTSLTLTASDQVMFVDLDWVPGNNEQAAARCHRIGQTRPVTVRCVMLENSFDQHISRVLMRKTAQLKSLMNGTLKGQTVEDVNELL
jgi:SNF2 family DNA or RNA helicase